MNGPLTQLAIPGVEVSATTLAVTDPSLSFETYEHLFDIAGRVGDSARWWLGDLLVFGDARYGESYAQVLGHSRISERQVERYRWVCARVDPRRRREDLSFTHHEEIASLEPAVQDRLLGQASAGGWTVKELRQHAKTEREVPAKPAARQLPPVVDTSSAAAGLVQQREALETAWRFVREDEGVTRDDVTLAIAPALEALKAAGEAVLAAERRLASPSLLDAVARLIEGAGRARPDGEDVYVVPADAYEELEAIYRAERGELAA